MGWTREAGMLRRRSEFSEELLEDIGRMLRSNDDFGQRWQLDLDEMELAVVTIESETDTSGRYLEIPLGRTSPGRLHAFARSLSDRVVAKAVWEAMDGGRGAYRRVRDLLHHQGIEELWYRFEAEQDRRDALDWLRQQGVSAEDAQP